MNDHYLNYQSINLDTNDTQIINQNTENSLISKDLKNFKEKQHNTKDNVKTNSRNNKLNLSNTQTIPIKQNKSKD